MKILFTSVFCDGTGYSAAAIETALAMEAGGIDTVCRSISLSAIQGRESSKRIQHLLNKDTQNVDAIIEMSLPPTFERKEDVKNIGMFFWETDRLPDGWSNDCNRMDEIWVSCLQTKWACIHSGVTVPIKIVPIACDIDKNRLDPLDIPLIKDKTIFYAISEFTHRKNFSGLLRAYYAAFTSKDNVALIIKTSVPGKNTEQSEQFVSQFIKGIKEGIHIHKEENLYPPVIIITKRLSDKMMDRLHATGNIFISCSHGESWNMPAAMAMTMGNTVILSNWGSHPELTFEQAKEYFDPDERRFRHPGSIPCGSLIDGKLEPCFSPDGGLSNGYKGNEFWFSPDLGNLISEMKYLKDHCFERYGQNAKLRASDFSYQRVGVIIKGALEC